MTCPVTITALLHGPDQKGLVSKTSSWIFDRDGNITHADQHTDFEEGIFFQRLEWYLTSGANVETHIREFEQYVTQELNLEVSIARSDVKPRVAVFVSKIDHCFHDFMLRWKAGEFFCDVPLIISNHETLRHAGEVVYGVPFKYIPVTKATKAEAEAQELALLREFEIDLVVMARYMQVLSDDFLKALGVPVINIHHSFLPAFKGARPYYQAYQRGVKIIGATAHYATPDLDEGPIIQQAVAQVNHRNSVQDLQRKGQDLEKSVLAQAVRWHLQSRVLAYHGKTVVFD